MSHATDEAGFLIDIITNYNDDTPRLVYADWLQEHGRESRAEFIRLQCELPKRRRVGRGIKRLKRRVDGFADEIGEWFTMPSPAWFVGPLDHTTDSRPTPHAAVNRGFIAEVTCTAEDWLAHADTLTWLPSQRISCPPCKGRTRVVAVTCQPGCGNVTIYPHAEMPAPGEMPSGYLGGVACERCGSLGQLGKLVDCPTCQHAGSIPRPCPITANPIRWVNLTTTPVISHRTISDNGEWYVIAAGNAERRIPAPPNLANHIWDVHDLLAAEWKGIAITLPLPF
jgi:uncharacterized protein (TIGR02996 family)